MSAINVTQNKLTLTSVKVELKNCENILAAKGIVKTMKPE